MINFIRNLINKIMKKKIEPGSMFNEYQKTKKKGVKKNWIAGAIKKPGALKKALGVKVDSKIPAKTLAKAAKKGGKLGQRARLAETLKGFKKAKLVGSTSEKPMMAYKKKHPKKEEGKKHEMKETKVQKMKEHKMKKGKKK